MSIVSILPSSFPYHKHYPYSRLFPNQTRPPAHLVVGLVPVLPTYRCPHEVQVTRSPSSDFIACRYFPCWRLRDTFRPLLSLNRRVSTRSARTRQDLLLCSPSVPRAMDAVCYASAMSSSGAYLSKTSKSSSCVSGMSAPSLLIVAC